MKILICQIDIQWESPKENLGRLTLLIDEFFKINSGIDLIVLPEFFSYGFTFNKSIIENDHGISLYWLKETANKYQCAVLGSVPIKDGQAYFNRAYFVTPDQVLYYDKRHLFSHGKEDLVFNSGKHRIIVDFRGWKIALNICYDLRFPVWSRNINLEYDLIIYLSNWPSNRIHVVEPLIRSRAIENQSYSIFVNRVGTDPNNQYNGKSLLSDYFGKIIISLGESQELVCVEIEKDQLIRYREHFRAWLDSDKFNIKD